MPTLKRLLAHEAVEVFGVLCLTTRRRILCWHEVSRGSIDRASVNARDVFIPALMINAPAIVLAHNHPSGDPEPSDADVELTEQLLQAGRVMGIDIVDHVVVGDGVFVSLALRGLRTLRMQSLSAWIQWWSRWDSPGVSSALQNWRDPRGLPLAMID